jgi:uncharacterized membrane protein
MQTLENDFCAGAGLISPEDIIPISWTFPYYVFVVGMTSQVSDVAIAEQPMRRVTLIHGAMSFILDIAILVVSVNLIAGVI